jgi:eukaryotic-like serine/threonine-protein kinase
MSITWRCFQGFCTVYCLLVALSACRQGISSTPLSTPTTRPSATATSGLAAAVQTCPAQATARGAVMPPMTAGNHPNIVYLSQEVNSSMLQRYDITTASTRTILQTNATSVIQEANVSPDGQWVLFTSKMQDQFAIQLIRMDGQQLQTLYCTPTQMSIDTALLSPDQHSLVFNQVNQDESMSTLYLLDMTTGKLQTELSPQQPNYPGIAQGQRQTSWLSLSSSSSSRDKAIDNPEVHPLPGTHYLIYIPLKWASNRSVYLLGTLRGSGTPPHQLALLRDISKDGTHQQNNLQPISAAAEYNECAMTPDNRQLVCSLYTPMGPGGPSAIEMQPITAGSASRSVYRSPTGGMLVTRALSNSTLIFILNKPGSPASLWKINTDGSGLTRLMAAQTTDAILNFAYYSYLPWSTISPDGTLYAIEVSSISGNTQSLLFGHLNGDTPTTIAANAHVFTLIGWSQL